MVKKYKALVRIGLLIPLEPTGEYLFNFSFVPRDIPAVQRELTELVKQYREEAPMRRKRPKILRNSVNLKRETLEKEGVKSYG